MGTVISNLKARFGVDTSDFKKGLKDGEKSIADFKGQAGDTLNKFAEMFGVNMSAVNQAIGTAGKSLNAVGGSFKGAAAGGNVFKIALNGVKIALIQTGIGAIVVALGSLIAYFTKSGEGADRFAKILAQVRSVFDNVIDRIMKLGKGLFDIMTGKFKQGWQEMTTAFKGIGEEIKNDWQEAGKLAEAEDKLEEKEIALITSLEERKAKISELRLLAKEETEDNRKKLALLNQAEALTKSVYADQIGVERERLRIMKEKLAIANSDPTDEQNRAIAEQEAKLNTLLREQNLELKGIVKERNSVTAAIKKEGEEIQKISMTGSLPEIDTTKLAKSLAQIPAVTKEAETALQRINNSIKDINSTIEKAVEGVVIGFAEWIGAFAAGAATFEDLPKSIFNTLGNMLIALGTIAIEAGIGIDAIKDSFASMNGATAVVMGAALIAFGVAIKSKVNAVPGNVTGGGAGGAGGGTFDTRKTTKNASQGSAQMNNGLAKVTFTIKGKDLACVLDMDQVRRGYST